MHSIGVLQFCGEVQRELALPVASGELLAIWLVESEEISEGVVAATALLALEDQQLAGLVMWVPAGAIYAGAAMAFAALWVRRSGSRWRQGHALHPR